jgi:hypothetical protein
MSQVNFAIEPERRTFAVSGPPRIEALPGTPTSGRDAALLRLNGAGERCVIGPKGTPMTLADLPAPDTRRWVAHRKAEVVAAVRGGLISLEDACSRYSLSAQEFLGWQQSMDRYGLAGLRATNLHQHVR